MNITRLIASQKIEGDITTAQLAGDQELVTSKILDLFDEMRNAIIANPDTPAPDDTRIKWRDPDDDIDPHMSAVDQELAGIEPDIGFVEVPPDYPEPDWSTASEATEYAYRFTDGTVRFAHNEGDAPVGRIGGTDWSSEKLIVYIHMRPKSPPPDELVEALKWSDLRHPAENYQEVNKTLAAAVRQICHAYELLYCAADHGWDYATKELIGDRADIHAAAHITAAKVQEMHG